jgi:hypothetical protein
MIRDIFNKYYCDKVESGYDKIYDVLLLPYKNLNIKLLEIGIGTVAKEPLPNMTNVPSSMVGWKERNHHYLPGASLRSFRDYFINGEIYGIDIQPDCEIEEERIKTFIFDSIDSDNCEKYLSKLMFDIIIDDGAHHHEYQIKTFQNLYPKLNKNGIYVIEDVVHYNQINDFFEKEKLNFKFIDNLFVIFN